MPVPLHSGQRCGAVPGAEGSRPPRNIRESEAGEFLTAPQTASVRDWVNQIAGSTRMLAHGQLFPGLGNQHDPDAWPQLGQDGREFRASGFHIAQHQVDRGLPNDLDGISQSRGQQHLRI